MWQGGLLWFASYRHARSSDPDSDDYACSSRQLEATTMSAHHGGHRHGMAKRTLRLAFFLTIIIIVAEVAGGILAHSLALLSDAGHALTDIFALGLAWFATAQAERPANARKTFGYHRVGILAALANAITLILITERDLRKPPSFMRGRKQVFLLWGLGG